MAAFYLPPADIDDFRRRRPELEPALSAKWNDYISGGISKRAAAGRLFYDAEHDPAPAVAATSKGISWNAFPRSIWQWFNVDANPTNEEEALATAEVLSSLGSVRRADDGQSVEIFERQQDEYCEWFVDRDSQGHITRISFTSEGPEYFEKMAEVDLSLVGELYREFVNPAVKDEDLVWPADMLANGQIVFPRGEYNKWNRWNVERGAMHLVHHANTLGAEINLAADSTKLFPSVASAPAATFHTRLMCCAKAGGENRSSDPRILADVNSLARQGLCVTLRNPVGLYISDIDVSGLRDPNNVAIPEALRIRRASADGSLILRAEIAPPPGASYTLDACTFEGHPIAGGGRFARRIAMVLFGIAKAVPGRVGQEATCVGKCCRKPDTGGFLAIVPQQQKCANLSDQFWNGRGPSVAGPQMAVAEEVTAEQLQQLLAVSRATTR